jgi:hypothetical protein
MTPDLSDEEKRALIELLTHTIEDDLYPLSPRIRTPKAHPRQAGAADRRHRGALPGAKARRSAARCRARQSVVENETSPTEPPAPPNPARQTPTQR